MSTVFLKLGGSLITDKTRPRTARLDTLARLMAEIAAARQARPELRLVLGHGSGSFGHAEAVRYGMRRGAAGANDWRGVAEVQYAAGLLNRLALDAAQAAGLAVVNFPPSALAVCRAGEIERLEMDGVQIALERGLTPLVFGDIALDAAGGATIVSTEDIFRRLAGRLRPARLLLAGLDPGVLSRWPDGEVVPRLTLDSRPAGLGRSHAADVTGGMAGKVSEMLALAAESPGLEIRIFSGETPGLVRDMLLGMSTAGTQVASR